MTTNGNSDINAILERFPKKRFNLPDEYKAIYEREYIANRTSGGFGNSAARRLESWMHKKTAASSVKPSECVLELGAGSLNHLQWEKNYADYDVVEPFQELLNKSSRLDELRKIYSSLREIPESRRYDRIISIAVLEHLLDLPFELARAALHLADDGRFCAGVPSEGGWLWKMAWKYGTGPGFARRTGLDYETLMTYEHVNTVDEIGECLRYFYDEVVLERFPLPIKCLSLYSCFTCHAPIKWRCVEFLDEYSKRLN